MHRESAIVQVKRDCYHGRHNGLMASALYFESNGPGSSPLPGYYVVFLEKKLNSH